MRRLIYQILIISLSSGALMAGRSASDIVTDEMNHMWQIRQETSSLEDFGKKTMTPSMRILKLGNTCVEPLIAHLAWEDDWMMRYVIIDLLGYLKTEKSMNTLASVVAKRTEDEIIRKAAVKALAMHKSQKAHTALMRLYKSVENKKIKKEIGKILKIIR